MTHTRKPIVLIFRGNYYIQEFGFVEVGQRFFDGTDCEWFLSLKRSSINDLSIIGTPKIQHESDYFGLNTSQFGMINEDTRNLNK